MLRHSVSVFVRTIEGEWRRDGGGGGGRGFVVVVKFLPLERRQRRRNKATTCAASQISPIFKLRSTCQSVTAYPIGTETYTITIRSSGEVRMGRRWGLGVEGGYGSYDGGGS